MVRIKSVKKGDPMGMKVNVPFSDEDENQVALNSLISALETYHGNQYIVGKDTSFIDTPHYHIHFFCAKEKGVTANALKVFRNSLKEKFAWLTRSDKLYTGQELESADPNRWIAYCIKETLVKSNGIDVTDEIKILSKAAFESKRQSKVYSEQKANEEKEKKEFKAKLVKYVRENLDHYVIPDKYKGALTHYKIHLLVTKFLMEHDKVNSLKKHIIDMYVMHCNIAINNWDEFNVLGNLYVLR